MRLLFRLLPSSTIFLLSSLDQAMKAFIGLPCNKYKYLLSLSFVSPLDVLHHGHGGVLAGGWPGCDWFLQRRLISRRISGALGSSTRPTSGAQVAEQQRPEVEDFTFDNGDVLAPHRLGGGQTDFPIEWSSGVQIMTGSL